VHADQLANIAISLMSSVALLVLISLGLAVAFGMMGVINLAHGEFLMLGAFFTLSGTRAGLNIWIAMIAAALAVGVVGVVVERLLLQHLYGRLAATMLATWGLGLLLVGVVELTYGETNQGIPTPLGHVRIGSYSISQYSLVQIAAAAGLLALTYVLFARTRYGTMARAASMLPDMAAAVGVDVRRTNMLTFGFASALAGAGGALLAPLTGLVPTMGQAYVGKAFMTVVVGGPGVLSGTASASGLLGGVNYLVSQLSSPVGGTVALLVVAIVVLRFLPTGISGRRERAS
jgi:branched-subunit amino acid ABC-type transport system permease component